jgi:hypothetical protein
MTVLSGPERDPFQVWQMQLPLPEKWEMIRCAWCDGCRTWFGPQTTNESTSTLADEYIGWIMIFWPPSVDQNSPQGDPFQVWQMQLPLPEKWGMKDALDAMAVGCDSAPRRPMRVHQRWQMNTLDESWYFDRPQWTRTHIRATLPRFDKCSSPSQKSMEWSDALDAMAVGCDSAPRRPMRVHQRWQMNTLDESWYFDHPQWTRTHLGATLPRFDKCSSHSLLQRSDWIGCNLPLRMTPGSNWMVMEAARQPQAKQGVILAPWSRQISTFSSKIQVQDLVPCPTVETVRVKKLEKRKVRVRQFSET